MTVPTFVDSSTNGAQSTSSVTPALPPGITGDDVLLMVVETANQTVTISNQNGGTWTQVPSSPQGTGAAAGTTATRCTVYWSRYNGTQGDPTLADSGNHTAAVIYAFRGCKTSGNPYNITSGNVDATSDTSLSATGTTTTAPDCLVCICATLMDDAQNFGGTWTNASLANLTARMNFAISSGNDGRLILVTGEKTAAGAYGATTNTLTASSVKGMVTVALEGAVSETTLTPGVVSVPAALFDPTIAQAGAPQTITLAVLSTTVTPLEFTIQVIIVRPPKKARIVSQSVMRSAVF